MAYFANGSEGMALDEQCEKCRGLYRPCPIAQCQINYNYDAVNNKVASEILNFLIKNDGTCTMFQEFKKELELSEDEKNQLELDGF